MTNKCDHNRDNMLTCGCGYQRKFSFIKSVGIINILMQIKFINIDASIYVSLEI